MSLIVQGVDAATRAGMSFISENSTELLTATALIGATVLVKKLLATERGRELLGNVKNRCAQALNLIVPVGLGAIVIYTQATCTNDVCIT